MHRATGSTRANFNPRSREGSDLKVDVSLLCEAISIHAPAKGATKADADRPLLRRDFNPRSREGSDPQGIS